MNLDTAGFVRLYRKPKPSLEGLQLDRMRQLLLDLGNPHHDLPPVFHIAGTNGKGSTLSACRSILEAMGHRVHAFSSPHLVHPRERFYVSGQMVDESILFQAMQHVYAFATPEHYSFFEFLVAVGFCLFSQYPADYLILETGLGGRLDATNVIPSAAATLITPIDYDHQDYLGSSLAKIAFEKAGIFKPRCPAIIAHQHPESLKVLLDRATQLNIQTAIADRDWNIGGDDQHFYFSMLGHDYSFPHPVLPGQHQWMNCGLAIAAIQTVVAQKFDEAAICKGLQTIHWPARLQKITHGRLYDLLPRSCQLWVDGAHNPHGMRAIADFFASKLSDRRLWVVMASLKNRDIASLLGPFLGLNPYVIAVSLQDADRCHPPHHIVNIAQSLGIQASIGNHLSQAMQWIANQCQPHDIILCAGSLYLAGEFLSENF